MNQLLVEMDGFETNKGVILMAATNRPEILDPALMRPGRLDRQVLVDRPDINGREAILKIHSRNVALGPEVDLRGIAGRTPGFVGADLANIINEAALLAARNDKETIGPADFDEAIDRVIGGLQKKNRVMNALEKEIAALGYTQQQPTEDRYLMTRSELTDRLAVFLNTAKPKPPRSTTRFRGSWRKPISACDGSSRNGERSLTIWPGCFRKRKACRARS